MSADNVSFSIERYDDTGAVKPNGWVKLFELLYNDNDNSCQFKVNQQNVFDLLNDKISLQPLQIPWRHFL
jgi:hypothetical protein